MSFPTWLCKSTSPSYLFLPPCKFTFLAIQHIFTLNMNQKLTILFIISASLGSHSPSLPPRTSNGSTFGWFSQWSSHSWRQVDNHLLHLPQTNCFQAIFLAVRQIARLKQKGDGRNRKEGKPTLARIEIKKIISRVLKSSHRILMNYFIHSAHFYVKYIDSVGWYGRKN